MYKIVGGDQREYGPATSDQIREWISTGRANAQTLASFEDSPFKALSTYPEFADILRASAPPPLPSGIYAAPGLPVQRSNNIAIGGLVLSIIGFCCSPLSLVGLILSIIGFLQIKKNPELYRTTTIVPILGIVLGALAIVLNIVVFSSGAFSEIMRNLPR